MTELVEIDKLEKFAFNLHMQKTDYHKVFKQQRSRNKGIRQSATETMSEAQKAIQMSKMKVRDTKWMLSTAQTLNEQRFAVNF